MYTHIWNKYLPILRILLKKSAAGAQTLNLNKIDFERAGSGRKAGYKFTIEFTRGRVANVISGSQLASDLAAVLLQDDVVKRLLADGDYQVNLNTKFQVSIKNHNPQLQTVPVETAGNEDTAQ